MSSYVTPAQQIQNVSASSGTLHVAIWALYSFNMAPQTLQPSLYTAGWDMKQMVLGPGPWEVGG
jgi:hypothetical protein